MITYRVTLDIPLQLQGFGISQANAYRYKDEGVEVLRALAPTLHDTLEKVAEQDFPT
ncbi:MAG TPA: hypothetical protein VHZ03_46000 [Trebonia sp.]|nr:hypothetical protein [Trebonia sp.]